MVGERQTDTRGGCRRHSDTRRRGRNGGIHGISRATRKELGHGKGADPTTDEEAKEHHTVERRIEEADSGRQTETAPAAAAEEAGLAVEARAIVARFTRVPLKHRRAFAARRWRDAAPVRPAAGRFPTGCRQGAGAIPIPAGEVEMVEYPEQPERTQAMAKEPIPPPTRKPRNIRLAKGVSERPIAVVKPKPPPLPPPKKQD